MTFGLDRLGAMARYGRDRHLGLVYLISTTGPTHDCLLGVHPQQCVMGCMGMAHKCFWINRARVHSARHERTRVQEKSTPKADLRMNPHYWF